MRIALADDHALFRAGLHSALKDAFGAATEVLEASDFPELIELLASDDELDLVLCDLRMPGMDPDAGVRDLADRRPGTPLVMVSASEGSTSTSAKLVCRLPWALNGLTRTRRCTPISVLR